jgi:hypothetical protein
MPDLTPEERRRIYLEEKEKVEASAKRTIPRWVAPWGTPKTGQ